MKAVFLKNESDYRAVMWEVRDGPRWWTVRFVPRNGSYSIMSDKLREIKPDGSLGKRLIEATKKKE